MISTREILERLISFDTTSRNSNLELMSYVQQLLNDNNIESQLLFNKQQSKANLYATVGPQQLSGVMLSGHTDVVPIDDQHWTQSPFKLTELHDRYYGRGTCDMKGFIASALKACIVASKRELKTPLHLALSYDEEIGCVGVQSLIDMLAGAPIKPAMCIVGEPTELKVATKHKGKTSLVARCIGTEAHSSLAPKAVNAIHLATDLINVLREKQIQIADSYSAQNQNNDGVPYTTVHVGRVLTDQALNIVPSLCTVHFEIRHTASDDPLRILDDIKHSTNAIVDRARQKASSARIEFEITNAYPGLNTEDNAQVVEFVKSLIDSGSTCAVAFGTEGGLFSTKAGIPTVVCGPGSMEQGHKPDEYIEISQLHQCDAMLHKLVRCLSQDDPGLT